MLGNFSDGQTADYIANSFTELGADIYGIDTRKIPQDVSALRGQEMIINEIKDIGVEPDFVLVLKGLELKFATLKFIKDLYPNAVFVNWFFDKFLVEKSIWETDKFFPVIEFYDFFYCSLKGVADKLKDAGFDNVYYLDEACYPPQHAEPYMNSFQKKKYGSDVAFVGNIGFFKQHADRVKMLTRVAIEGFNLKVWGNVVCDRRLIPPELRECLEDRGVIN